jgi:2-polyprenyl-3-methyl-5-hydroxy-6-metoxy-1,4-benzoquinol methylase
VTDHGWDGDKYQRQFDDLAAGGASVHGEVDFLMTLAPKSVLDVGCGTGRVAIELARRGVRVAGVEMLDSMLVTARSLAPELEWIEHEMSTLDLGRTFDVVAMAGNVPLFTPEGTHAALVAGCARHVSPGGALVSGFQLNRGYDVDEYDAHCAAAGLTLEARYATWDQEPFPGDGSYAVSVSRRITPA